MLRIGKISRLRLIFPIFFDFLQQEQSCNFRKINNVSIGEHNTDSDKLHLHFIHSLNPSQRLFPAHFIAFPFIRVGVVPRGRTPQAPRGHCAVPQDQYATLQVLKMPAGGH